MCEGAYWKWKLLHVGFRSVRFEKEEKYDSAVPQERPAVDSKILTSAMGLEGFSAICQRAEVSMPAGWVTTMRLCIHKIHRKTGRGPACKLVQD